MDEGIKLHKCVWAEGVGEDLLGWVGCGEFGVEVGEVGECEFARVGFFGDADIDYVVGDEIAVTFISLGVNVCVGILGET